MPATTTTTTTAPDDTKKFVLTVLVVILVMIAITLAVITYRSSSASTEKTEVEKPTPPSCLISERVDENGILIWLVRVDHSWSENLYAGIPAGTRVRTFGVKGFIKHDLQTGFGPVTFGASPGNSRLRNKDKVLYKSTEHANHPRSHRVALYPGQDLEHGVLEMWIGG